MFMRECLAMKHNCMSSMCSGKSYIRKVLRVGQHPLRPCFVAHVMTSMQLPSSSSRVLQQDFNVKRSSLLQITPSHLKICLVMTKA